MKYKQRNLRLTVYFADFFWFHIKNKYNKTKQRDAIDAVGCCAVSLIMWEINGFVCLIQYQQAASGWEKRNKRNAKRWLGCRRWYIFVYVNATWMSHFSWKTVKVLQKYYIILFQMDFFLSLDSKNKLKKLKWSSLFWRRKLQIMFVLCIFFVLSHHGKMCYLLW